MKKRWGIGLLGLSLFFLGLASGAGVRAQGAGEESPLTESEVYKLLQEKVSSADVAAMVRARGIAFEVTAKFEENLGILKAKPILLQTIKTPAQLEITANAAGAEVSVDGEGKGNIPAEGPLVVEGLGAGNHVLRISSPEYVTKTETVFLKPGETHPLAIEMAGAVTALPEPLGIRVNVQAGTGPDATLNEIDVISDPVQKVERIQQMIDSYADSPLALLGYRMLQETHLRAKEYDQALAAGEQLLQRDPRNFGGLARQIRALLGKGDLDGALDQAQGLVQLLEEAKAQPAPEGRNTEEWESEKEQAFKRIQPQLRAVDYELFASASEAGDPPPLERFLGLFPDSAYRKHAYAALAFAYQRQGDMDKMLEWGGRALEADPDQPAVLAVVADTLSQRAADGDRAEEMAIHLLALLTNEPERIRPQGYGDEQWAQQRQMWEGIAHSALGQVLLQRDKTLDAIEKFRTCTPLLKGQAQLYARNLYHLGFSYAKLGGRGNMQQAQKVLSELVTLGTVYAPPARDLLTKVESALAGSKK